VQLVDAETGAHLWADRFDTDRVNLPEAQDAIVGRIARTLNVELLKDAGRRIERERMADPDARDLVMYGRALFNRPYSVATFKEAQLAYEQALEKDPGLVDAKIGIASVFLPPKVSNSLAVNADRERVHKNVMAGGSGRRSRTRSQLQ
jgi:adenylate cyclase